MGNDSKALMKVHLFSSTCESMTNIRVNQVFLPAIAGHVPSNMVRCISAFIDFCYLARRSSHTPATLLAMETALSLFHRHRTVFEEAGIVPNGFALPRQHSLVHYVQNIRLFESPPGLDSAITESKHIKAEKEPWRESSRNNAVHQMIIKNSWLSQMAAIQVELGRRGMLDTIEVADDEEEADEDAVDGSPADSKVTLSVKHGEHKYLGITTIRTKHVLTADRMRSSEALAVGLAEPRLQTLIQRFLHTQLYLEDDLDLVLPGESPSEEGNIAVHLSARAVFHAPSNFSGTGGMHRQMIRSNPSFCGRPRFDTVLVQVSDTEGSMGFSVARVLASMVIKHEEVPCECCLVHWFRHVGHAPDPDTGLWMVEPELGHGRRRICEVIHIDCIVRPCQLIGFCGSDLLPTHGLDSSRALDNFHQLYVSRHIDYHAHECIY
jgi:hypothetical protein